MDDTQYKSGDDQGADLHLSGELHLPHSMNTGIPFIASSAQTELMGPPPVSQMAGNNNQEVFYLHDDLSLEEDEAAAFDAGLATPFQMSEAMPPVLMEGRQHEATFAPPPVKQSIRRFPLVRVFILVTVIVLVVLTGAVVFAQSSPSGLPVHTPPTQQGNPLPQPTPAKKNTPTTKPTNPTVRQNSGGSGTWLPQQLPTGWADAGLATGDALFSERTAIAFTDREMSLDFRSVGTREQHGGTFTAATFVLTANAKQRFAQNDIRAINNVLFENVQQEKLIQSVVDPQPQLVKFSVIGQQQVAWVDVSFQLWQSKSDATGTRREALDTDLATNQPRTHHMMVLLLRVAQDVQGNNPAMGGTGWLVSTYALDLPTGATLDIAQPA